MNALKFLKLLPAALAGVMLVTACGSDDPVPPENEIPTDEISFADFVGAWKLEAQYPIYRIFDADRTGSLIDVGEADDPTDDREQAFVWKYQNQTLTMTYKSAEEIYTVAQISATSMTLADAEGHTSTYLRIKKSEIPGNGGGGNDDGGNDDGGDIGDVTIDVDLQTVSAEPSAYRAVVSGRYSGGKLPETLGFDICYDRNFPKKYTRRMNVQNKFGGFSAEVTNLVDLATVYYRAVATVDGKDFYGEIKSFNTTQGTYKLNGTEYKFIKVTGLASGSFSMMQTELPPDATIEIDGKEYVLNDYHDDEVTKAEMINFCEGWPVMIRYPSVQEWIYAASGGQLTNGYKYSGSDNVDEVAWYSGNSNGRARNPAQKKANTLGFYDMSGNYAELCAVYDEDIISSWRDRVMQFNSTAAMSALQFNTMWRTEGGVWGGSWQSSASDCTISSSVAITGPNNKNCYDCTVNAVRWTYSRPD